MISLKKELLAKELEKLNILIIPTNIAIFDEENNIIELYLSRFGIKTLPNDFFENEIFSKLQKLYLNSNKLTNIEEDSFSPLKDLEYLNLGRNYIFKIDKSNFSSLNSLQELDLSNNKISFIEENSFDDLSSLKVLNLKNNSLDQVDDQLLVHLENLESLDLGINKLRFVPKAVNPLYDWKISSFNLKGNYVPYEFGKTFKNAYVTKSFLSEFREFWKNENLTLEINNIENVIHQYLFDSLMSVYHYSVNVPVLNYSLLGITLGYMAKNFHLLVNYLSSQSADLTFQETIILWYNCLKYFEPIEKALIKILNESEEQNERQRRILERKQKLLSELEKEIQETGGIMDYRFKKSSIEDLELEPIHENLFNLIKQFMDWNKPELSTIFL